MKYKGLNRKELFVDGSSVKNVMSLEEVQQLYPGGTISGSSYVKDGNVIAKKEASGNNYKLEDDYYAPLLKELGRTALLNYNLSFSKISVITAFALIPYSLMTFTISPKL